MEGESRLVLQSKTQSQKMGVGRLRYYYRPVPAERREGLAW